MGYSARVGIAGGPQGHQGGSAGGSPKVVEITRPCLILVDPRPLTLESVAHLLTTRAHEFAVLPVSTAGELGGMAVSDASLAVLNVGFSLLSDPWVSREIESLLARLPGCPVVILSNSEDTGQVSKALACGVRGYIPTTLSPRVAIEAIRLVHAGGTFIPASVLDHADKGHRQAEADSPEAARSACSDAESDGGASVQAASLPGLTPRQSEVLQLLCEGQPNKNIAFALGMQEGTVKVHVRQIMKKMRVTNRTQVAFLVNRQRAGDKART